METFCRLFSLFFVFWRAWCVCGIVVVFDRLPDTIWMIFFQCFSKCHMIDIFSLARVCVCLASENVRCIECGSQTKNDRQINQLHILHELLLPLIYFFQLNFKNYVAVCAWSHSIRADTVAVAAKFFGEYIYSFLISLGIKLKHVGVIKSNK